MNEEEVQKKFIIGDKWLYYKIYCGVKTADELLIQIIKPLIDILLEQKIINKWFFVRYSDPESHLRIRFHLIDLNEIGSVISKMKNILTPYFNSYQVWDVQIGSYKREVNRYGSLAINDIETFFYLDSETIITIIKDSKNDYERFFALFQWLETMFSFFELQKKDLLIFLEVMQKQFKKEFNVNKDTKKQLSIKYRALEKKLSEKIYFVYQQKKEIQKITEKFLTLNKEQKLDAELEDLIASFVHMSINRCFRTKQRLYEMMLYDFLYKKTKSKFKRNEIR